MKLNRVYELLIIMYLLYKCSICLCSNMEGASLIDCGSLFEMLITRVRKKSILGLFVVLFLSYSRDHRSV